MFCVQIIFLLLQGKIILKISIFLEFKIFKKKNKMNRYGHTWNCIGDQILLFGGFDGKNYLSDVFLLDTHALSSNFL